MRKIQSDQAPAPVGPYSQAIEIGQLVFCSGQIPLHPTTGEMIGINEAEQTAQVMENLKAVLGAADLTLKNIVKTTIYLTNMKAFAEVNRVYEEKLEGHKPARGTVEVSALPKGALVEIECIASR